MEDPIDILKNAKSAIIVPGYGMALAQAQHLVKSLRDWLLLKMVVMLSLRFIRWGRMPGHMNVLLAEAGIDYEEFYEMDDINPEFKNTDVTIVVVQMMSSTLQQEMPWYSNLRHADLKC